MTIYIKIVDSQPIELVAENSLMFRVESITQDYISVNIVGNIEAKETVSEVFVAESIFRNHHPNGMIIQKVPVVYYEMGYMFSFFVSTKYKLERSRFFLLTFTNLDFILVSREVKI